MDKSTPLRRLPRLAIAAAVAVMTETAGKETAQPPGAATYAATKEGDGGKIGLWETTPKLAAKTKKARKTRGFPGR